MRSRFQPLAASLVAAVLFPTFAIVPAARSQNNIILFGSGKDTTLPYRTRTQSPGAQLNSFYFYLPLPSNKAVAEIQIRYPQEFRSAFGSGEKVSIRDRGSKASYKIREIIADRELGSVRFVLAEPIPAKPNQQLELYVASVSNPTESGMYRIEAQALGTEANPLFQFLGQWQVSIYK